MCTCMCTICMTQRAYNDIHNTIACGLQVHGASHVHNSNLLSEVTMSNLLLLELVLHRYDFYR